MVSCTMKYQLRLVLFFILCVFGNSDIEKDKEECTQSLIGLATCLPYVGGNAPAPTPDCCTGLKQVLKASKKCLCLLIKDRNDPDVGLQLNVTLALTLPSVCKAPANISECPALLHLPANSPDAQVFYQIANNSSSIAGSPSAHSPIPSVGSSPTGAPAGAPKSAGCHIGKRWFGLEAIIFRSEFEFSEFTYSIMIGSSVENEEAKPLGRWSVLAYGVGHVLNDITSTYWYSYLLLYLTGIGMPPKQVAALAITAQFTDATMTIIAGELIDRFGHFKIWHAVGTVLVSAAFSSFYWGVCVPCKIIGIDTPLVQMIGYYMFDIIFSGGWSCTQVSHMAMVNGLTLDQTSRVACVSCRNAFTMVASLIVYGIGFFIFNSSVKQVEIKEQYHLLATITVLIGCFFVILFHLGTKEPRVKQVSHTTNPRGSSWKRWLKNGLYYRVASIYVLTRVVTNISQVFLALYVISDLHMSQSSKALVPAIIYLCSFITSILLQELEWSSHRLKAIFSVGGFLWLFCSAVVLSLPINMNVFMYILSVVIGIANAFMMVTSVGMESELVDKEVEGSAFVYGSLGCVEKVLCGVMLYILESYESVTPAACNPAYPCFTVTRFSLGFIPGVAALAGVIVTCFTKFRTSHPDPLAEPLLA
ncbi:hypothetical protein KY290_002023 [Solanum tuberosum]|uniref:Bifunctional inhibitor/plant lipid transfer protein/seed storage helical domain-containing protein n=1 Tax=Solanum tuberosum TaxID=4113 RepID=A0ABQ7WNV2_SOLTU|nr:hypothetical protein KY290_002023 [Solanum tuberosum]